MKDDIDLFAIGGAINAGRGASVGQILKGSIRVATVYLIWTVVLAFLGFCAGVFILLSIKLFNPNPHSVRSTPTSQIIQEPIKPVHPTPVHKRYVPPDPGPFKTLENLRGHQMTNGPIEYKDGLSGNNK